jgi:hypothetical protein
MLHQLTGLRKGLLLPGGEMAERYADLEIAFRWVEEHGRHGLDVNLRFVLSDQQVDNWKHPGLLNIDLAELGRKKNDVDGYAEALTRMVFRQADAAQEMAQFYAASLARAEDRPIHLRLNLIGPPEVHDVRWELLRDPTGDHSVTTSDGVLFSRYLTSPDFRMIPWRTKQLTRALVVIAAPSDLGGFAPRGQSLANVDVAMERRSAEAALEGIETTYLAGPGQATLANLARELEREVDILYLVCHGAIRDDVPFVMLEKADGTADTVDGRRLAERVFSLEHRPTLAMLNSCQSAAGGGHWTTTDDGVLAGLGPRLAGAGIATVIAMQGNVSMETANHFATTFFEELRRDGVVDRAVATARMSLRDRNRPDWWAPALFSRLRSGRTYFKAEFSENGETTWDFLVSSNRTGRFIPLLGPGMTDGILGSPQAIAKRWADRWQMSIMSHHRDDLAKVAQYLLVELKGRGEVPTQMEDYLKAEIRERIAAAGADDPFYGLDPAEEPAVTITQAGRRLLADPEDVFRTVAAMPAEVFVTTNWTQLLEQALEAHIPKKVPSTLYFPWNSRAEWPESSLLEPPTVERPLVYHLFGRMEDVDSLVITEDDYFEWLTSWVDKRELVPKVVKKRLVNRSLLFLGHRLDDWEFRVVFQGIKSLPASGETLRDNRHVGVQLNPGHQVIEPGAAQDYLESQLGNDKVSIYWADTKKFLEEYRSRTGMRT